ncbi:hypothetical protein COV12_01505 [Candidatus Woesearchaeota archaeon CG10_big_fil_rev_8_21_14_0_10_32_24]|nr:MAG: hypothetical protein COV12_01505 [Candidatus Woesearchaeota archaeon CG10_big_fil_rev_8_21_14_0_10_32_24]
MVTLEQILEDGTDAEKELVNLSLDQPINQMGVLKQEIKNDLKIAIFASAGMIGSICLGYNGYNQKSWVWQTLGYYGLLMMGSGVVLSCNSLSDHLTLLKDYKQFIGEPKNKSSKNDVEFYWLNVVFISEPTPIAKKLGQPIYPLKTFEEITHLNQDCLVYLSSISIKETDFNNYNDLEIDDYVPGSGFGWKNITHTKRTLEFNSKDDQISLEIDRKMDDQFNDFYHRLISEFEHDKSVLLRVSEGKVRDIIEVYSSSQTLKKSYGVKKNEKNN